MEEAIAHNVSISRKDLEDDSESYGSGSGSESSEVDVETRNFIKEKLGQLNIEFVEVLSNTADEPNDQPLTDELEFRLFSGPTVDNFTKIRIRSPEIDDLPGAFVVARRPLSYYFQGDLSKEQEKQLNEVAVSGELVISQSSTIWSGCHLPWKVLTVTQSRKDTHGLEAHSHVKASGKTKRTRLGKKSRIAKRKKLAAVSQQKLEKESHLRDKKTKKNRAQQLKRREKARQLRAATGGTQDKDDVDST